MNIRSMLSLSLVLAAWPALAAPVANTVPGTVIDYSPAASGLYIGSPSIVILPNGDYVASHDEFGPKSTEHQEAVSQVFRSHDRGLTWKKVSTIHGAFWSTLFVHRDALYLIGPHRHHGNILIRRSTDGGDTWTTPTTAANGVLRDNGEYHCAPMPVIEHQGRLWRAFEWRNPPIAWGINYRAGMLSAPVDADLLNAASWTLAEPLPSDRAWNNNNMGAWLEGNAVKTRDGKIVDILRVETKTYPEKAAIVNVNAEGTKMSFDPATGFIDFPGGAKKFTIRFDAKSDRYWSLATLVPEKLQQLTAGRKPASVRNTLALISSPNLTNWTTSFILLHHPDTLKHGFQYVDWQFDGDDMIVACRTAYDDAAGGAHNAHDANFLTFHRISNFRAKTEADSVPLTEWPTPLRKETKDLVIVGAKFAPAALDNGAKAFSNRPYTWEDVPDTLRGWQYTQTAGGEAASLTVTAKTEGTLYAATTTKNGDTILTGWKKTGQTFCYTDKNKTKVSVFSRKVKAEDAVTIPQAGWCGTLVLWPADKN